MLCSFIHSYNNSRGEGGVCPPEWSENIIDKKQRCSKLIKWERLKNVTVVTPLLIVKNCIILWLSKSKYLF